MNTSPLSAREIEALTFNHYPGGPLPAAERSRASQRFVAAWVRLRKWLRCAPVVASAADWTFPGL
jgi:hypothetical protein